MTNPDYDSEHGQWVLREGDLATWLAEDGTPVRCRIELVTYDRVYLMATSGDPPLRQGQVWYESRISRRVAPRRLVYVHNGRGHFDWRTVRIES